MAIWVNKDTRLLVQGITGKEGTFHALGCRDYGTQVVAGVTPGKGGETVEGIPVFDSVAEAREATGANASMIFVPPPFAADAIMEAADAGIELVVCITEGIPVNDMLKVKAFLRDHPTRLIGPNCPGVITPGMAQDRHHAGAHPPAGHDRRGQPLGHADLRGGLAAHATWISASRPASASAAIRSTARTSSTCCEQFTEDPETDGVIMIGEIGGSAEEEAAAWIKANMKKPVVGFIAGRTAPPGRRMGHAGAIISGGKGTAAEKIEAMRDAGIHVTESPAELGSTMARALGR